MINTSLIRNRILDKAIQGYLIKADRTLAAPVIPECEDTIQKEDIPFQIPLNWRWAKLGWVMGIERGGSPRPIKAYLTSSEDGINWIKIGDVAKNGKYIEQTKEKIKPEGESKSRRVYPGDFLLTNSMSFGRPYISKIEGCVHDGWLILRNDHELFYYDYLYYLLSSPYAYSQFSKKATGSTVDNLNIDKVAAAIVPVPPLKEQETIVQKIEDIYRELDILDEKQAAYERDYDVLRSKIIDAGIQGKLTEQLAEDGSAEDLVCAISNKKKELQKAGIIKKSKPLPAVSEDEVPFEIPENWKWVHLDDITTKITSGSTPTGGRKSNVYVERGNCFFREQNIYNDGIHQEGMVYITDELLNTRENSTVYAKDILLNITGGSIGRCALIPDDFDKGSINQHILIIRMVDERLRFYIHRLLCSPYAQRYIKNKSVGDKDGFSGGRCKQMLIPVPPLAEQQRIAEKIDEVLSAMSVAG